MKKIPKKTENSTIKLLSGGPTEEKTKKWQKKRKIALLSLYLLHLYHV